jgi:hypothetical protein
MRIRLAAAAAVAGIAVAAVPGFAAKAPKPQITDPTGDANAVNGQGVLIGSPETSTPADASSADIKSVLFRTTFKSKKVHGKVVKVATGSTLTMTTTAAPTQAQVLYRVTVTTPGCDSEVFFEYESSPATPTNGVRCAHADLTSTDYGVPAAVVKGNSVIWSLPLKAFPAGTTLSGLAAETRGNPGLVYAPVIDEASSSATFTVGK